jgi:hypothetical protein
MAEGNKWKTTGPGMQYKPQSSFIIYVYSFLKLTFNLSSIPSTILDSENLKFFHSITISRESLTHTHTHTPCAIHAISTVFNKEAEDP